MINFLYSVITRKNCKEAEMSFLWWMAHPTWNFYVRTDVRRLGKPNVWLGGGGVTLEEALANATQSVQLNAPMNLVVSEDGVLYNRLFRAEGKESPVMIKNSVAKEAKNESVSCPAC